MKHKKRTYKQIGEYGIKSRKHAYQFQQLKKIYTARTEKELLEYLKEKGIL